MTNLKWTQQEIDYLINNYLTKGPESCSTVLERSPMSIKNKACSLNLTAAYRQWTKQEIDFLIKNSSTKTNKELSIIFKTTPNVIRSLLYRYKLKSWHRPPQNKKIYSQQYRVINANKIATRQHQTYLKNKEKIQQRNYAYIRQQSKTNPYFRLTRNIRNRIKGLLRLKKIHKTHPTFELIGCNINELKLHLQSKFTDGMSGKITVSGMLTTSNLVHLLTSHNPTSKNYVFILQISNHCGRLIICEKVTRYKRPINNKN